MLTHNKIPTEKADYMTEITQDKKGVTKIISVKMKERKIEETVHSIEIIGY